MEIALAADEEDNSDAWQQTLPTEPEDTLRKEKTEREHRRHGADEQ